MQLCQVCQKNPATVHVTEIESFPVVEPGEETDQEPVFEQKHVCDACADRGKIPYSGVAVQSKSFAMFNMLKESARRVREESALTCPDCGMTFAEFRSKGRLGCPRDYEVFSKQLQPLLLRIHNATRHVGGRPTERPEVDESQRERLEHLTTLRAKLEQAIQAEAYESAAQIRDQIQQLESAAD